MLTPNKIKQYFNGKKILLLKRCMHGQLYICQGFRNMVHFTVGTLGKKEIEMFFTKMKVPYTELRGYANDKPPPSWIYALSMPNPMKSRPTELQSTLHNKIKQAAIAFLPHLLKVCYYVCLTYISNTNTIMSYSLSTFIFHPSQSFHQVKVSVLTDASIWELLTKNATSIKLLI